MIEIIGFAATVTLFSCSLGLIFAVVNLMRDDDPYFFRKMETDAWCAYMTFSCFIAISLVIILFLLP